MARASCAALAAVDLKLRGVQIDRRVLARVAAKRTVKAPADARDRALDSLDVTAPKAPGELACRRRGRHPPRATKTGPRPVSAQIFDVVEALAIS